MSHVYMAADLHLGHKNIHNFRTQFASAEEHDATVKENFESILTKKDKLFLLGDIAFTRDALEWVKSLPCNKVLICGNHDTDRDVTMKELADVYDEIHSLYVYKGWWLSHCPIHPAEVRGKNGVIYGHCHNKPVADNNMICVSLEHTDMKPIKFSEVILRKRGD